jgi:Protein of unknown function (DUF2778)
MWRYRQSTGEFFDDDMLLCVGYAGRGAGKNNPAMAQVQCTGPIPVGRYTINRPIDTKTHGPYVMWLTPHPDNVMFGRSAFGIHGDSVIHPGEASEGCIILPRMVRERIGESGDDQLEVVS